MVGAGQLARMTHQAAIALGQSLRVLAADPADPAAVPAEIPLNAASFPDVRVVDQSYWISGVGPLGGQAVLDDVEQFLQDRAGS